MPIPAGDDRYGAVFPAVVMQGCTSPRNQHINVGVHFQHFRHTFPAGVIDKLDRPRIQSSLRQRILDD